MSWIQKHKNILKLKFIDHTSMSLYEAFSGTDDEKSWISVMFDVSGGQTDMEKSIRLVNDWIEELLDRAEIIHKRKCEETETHCDKFFDGKCRMTMFEYRSDCITYEEFNQILDISNILEYTNPDMVKRMKSTPYTANGLIEFLTTCYIKSN